MAEERDEVLADDLIDDAGRDISQMMREAKDRRGYARVAANIAEDRYGAGSAAARCAVAIFLKHGIVVARNFIADLEHHES